MDPVRAEKVGQNAKMARYAPRGLSAEAKRLFREVVVQNGLDTIDDAASMTLLENASRALMRLREAEAVIRREGQTVRDRFRQLKPHPMAARIDCEGLTIRQSLAAIANHSAAARYQRGLDDRDPWGHALPRQAGTGPTV